MYYIGEDKSDPSLLNLSFLDKSNSIEINSSLCALNLKMLPENSFSLINFISKYSTLEDFFLYKKPARGAPTIESNKGHQPKIGKSWLKTKPKQLAPKPPRIDKNIAKAKLEETLPLNLRTIFAASPPSLFHPLCSNQPLIPVRTSKAGNGE